MLKKVISMTENKQHDDKLEATPDEQSTELEQKAAKAEEYLAGWQRAKADYSNYKKEAEKRQQEIIQFANAGLMADLFPIIDNLKLAMRHVPEEAQQQPWFTGFAHITKQIAEFLEKFGIVEIKTVGEKFNPELHEAISHEEKDGFGSDIIFEEAQPGYTMHGKVLQPARVKVAK